MDFGSFYYLNSWFTTSFELDYLIFLAGTQEKVILADILYIFIITCFVNLELKCFPKVLKVVWPSAIVSRLNF